MMFKSASGTPMFSIFFLHAKRKWYLTLNYWSFFC